MLEPNVSIGGGDGILDTQFRVPLLCDCILVWFCFGIMEDTLSSFVGGRPSTVLGTPVGVTLFCTPLPYLLHKCTAASISIGSWGEELGEGRNVV